MLRHSNHSDPGYSRKRMGRYWAYFDENGERVTDREEEGHRRGLPVLTDEHRADPAEHGEYGRNDRPAAMAVQLDGIFTRRARWRVEAQDEGFVEQTPLFVAKLANRRVAGRRKLAGKRLCGRMRKSAANPDDRNRRRRWPQAAAPT